MLVIYVDYQVISFFSAFKMTTEAFSAKIVFFILLGSCFAYDELNNTSFNSTQSNISGALSQGSFGDPVELCLTWWISQKRFYKSCVIKYNTYLLGGPGPDLENCVNQIKDSIPTSIKTTITVLKLQGNGQCSRDSNTTANVCMLVLKNGKPEVYTLKIQILLKQRYLVHIYSDVFRMHGFDIYELTGAVPLTSLSIDCETALTDIRKGNSLGVSTIIPGTISNCLIQEVNGGVRGEYCLEYIQVESFSFKVIGNCSLSENSLGVKPLLNMPQCNMVKLKAFCIVETLPHNYHNDLIFTYCARPLLPFEDDNITNWKTKVGKNCLVQNPIDSIRKRGNDTDYITMDINDEDILREENMCAIYSGDFPYSDNTQKFAYYLQMIIPFFATTGIICNIFALIGAAQQTANGSVKVYIGALTLSNIAVAVNYICFFCLRLMPLFSHVFCIIEPILHRTFANISLLVMLGLSVERTIAVFKPLLTKSWCTVSRAKKVRYFYPSNSAKYNGLLPHL